MSQSYPDLIDDLNRDIRKLRGASPTAMQAFSALAGAALAPGQLDVKTKELIAVAIAVAVRCDGCVGFHVKAAIRAGAGREELAETVAMAIYMGAGPSMIQGAEALRAFDELAAETSASGKDPAS
jgi:AhpD family alkylhydroperoxidase